jgi:hypothetical protein
MEINGVNSQSTHAHPLGKLHPKDNQEPQPAEQESAGQASGTEQTTETSDAEGVLRLLQKGHFKGTSDVRLRINFAEKINAIEAAKLREVAGQKVDGILDSVNTILGTLNTSGDPPPVSNTELPPVDADGDGIIDTYGLPNTASAPAAGTTEEQPDEVTQQRPSGGHSVCL